jgi:hypothetical protein
LYLTHEVDSYRIVEEDFVRIVEQDFEVQDFDRMQVVRTVRMVLAEIVHMESVLAFVALVLVLVGLVRTVDSEVDTQVAFVQAFELYLDYIEAVLEVVHTGVVPEAVRMQAVRELDHTA